MCYATLLASIPSLLHVVCGLDVACQCVVLWCGVVIFCVAYLFWWCVTYSAYPGLQVGKIELVNSIQSPLITYDGMTTAQFGGEDCRFLRFFATTHRHSWASDRAYILKE